MTQTVVGIFDEVKDAQLAIDQLLASGFSRDNIDFTARNTGTADTNSSSDRHEEGFGESISKFFSNLFSDDEDEAKRYTSVAERGNVVTVHTSSTEESQRVADVLDKFGSVDIDERSRAYASGDYNTSNYSTSETTAISSDADRTIPVVEEDLQVGKREVETGGIRVRSRIVERPVEEKLRLREERVFVDRHAVDRPATEADFREETIEITQHAEVPVVAKEARVVEEIRVGKAVQENEETVQGTVRHTDVEVDDQTRRDTTGLGATKG